jgi:hypothetical protein
MGWAGQESLDPHSLLAWDTSGMLLCQPWRAMLSGTLLGGCLVSLRGLSISVHAGITRLDARGTDKEDVFK